MQRIKISAFFIFTISLATSTGWHETFNTDVAADSITGELPTDYTWYWWPPNKKLDSNYLAG